MRSQSARKGTRVTAAMLIAAGLILGWYVGNHEPILNYRFSWGGIALIMVGAGMGGFATRGLLLKAAKAVMVVGFAFLLTSLALILRAASI